MKTRLNRDKTYQLWITEYALDGNSPASQFDPGYQLVGTYKSIAEAVEDLRSYEYCSPIITKLVIYKTEIIDITEVTALSEKIKMSQLQSDLTYKHLGSPCVDSVPADVRQARDAK